MKTTSLHCCTSFLTIVAVLVCAGSAAAQTPAPATAPANPQEETKQEAASSQESKEKNTTEAGDADESKEEETPEPIEVKVDDGRMQFSATGNWNAVQPRNNIVEAEIQIPKVGDDEKNGRLTIMGAGGSVEANIDRWKTQFKQADGSDTSEKTKTEVKTIADQKVHMVEITGTFLDSAGGPFSQQPKVERESYRMMAAIIEIKDSPRKYFVKFYGPKATVDQNEQAFKDMINSLKIVD